MSRHVTATSRLLSLFIKNNREYGESVFSCDLKPSENLNAIVFSYFGKKYIYILASKNNKRIISVDFKDGTKPLQFKYSDVFALDSLPVRPEYSYVSLSTNGDYRLNLAQTSPESFNIYQGGNLSSYLDMYLKYTNPERMYGYFFKYPLSKEFLESFDIKNSDNKITFTNKSYPDIVRKFLNSHYDNGHIYTDCIDQAIKLEKILLNRVETRLVKDVVEIKNLFPSGASYYNSNNYEHLKQKVLELERHINLIPKFSMEK